MWEQWMSVPNVLPVLSVNVEIIQFVHQSDESTNQHENPRKIPNLLLTLAKQSEHADSTHDISDRVDKSSAR